LADHRLILHAVVKDDGSLSYEHDGQTRLAATVADGIQAMRALAQAEGVEVEAILAQTGRQPQHIVLKPGGQLRSISERPPAASAGSAGSTGEKAAGNPERGTGVLAPPAAPARTGEDPQSGDSPDGGDAGAEDQSQRGPVVGGPYSGPARGVPVSRRAQKEARKEAQREAQRQGQQDGQPRRGKRLLILLAAISATIVAVAGASLLLPGGLAEDSLVSVSGSGQASAQNQLSYQDSPTAVPGYADDVQWTVPVDGQALTTATAQGLLVVEEDSLRVHDIATGAERFETDLDGSVDYVVETTVQGRHALLWRIGDRAYALPEGSTEPVAYTLPAGARLSSAGSSVLVRDGEDLYAFGLSGLVDIAAPDEDLTPMALEGSRLVSARFEGPLVITDYSGREIASVDLERPSEEMHLIRWVSAGHGLVITIWGEEGATVSSGHRVELVTHSISDGSILSTTSTTTDSIGEADWVRGQGYELAYIGPYLYSMRSGLLVLDGSAQQLDFQLPVGQFAPAESPEGRVLVQGTTAYRTDVQVLAALEGTAIVRSTPTLVEAHPLEP
jgi:hypothetical protein